MKILRSAALGAVLVVCAGTAHAVVIINGATMGLYNSGIGEMAPFDGAGGFLLAANSSEGDPTVSLVADPLSAFAPYPAAFGTDWLGGDYTGGAWSGGPVVIPVSWVVNTETAIVYDFVLGSASDIHIDLGVDNGILVWLDGVFLLGEQAGGGANINEYDIDLTAVSAGSHSLQILREDHGGSTGYAISVDATPTAAGVPEPTSLLLLGLGLVGVGFARRRRD